MLDVFNQLLFVIVLQMECLSWWDVGDKLVLLAEDIKTGIINCLVSVAIYIMCSNITL